MDACYCAADIKYITQHVANQHRYTHGFRVIVVAQEEDEQKESVDDDKGDAHPLVQPRVIGLYQILWQKGAGACHGSRVTVGTGGAEATAVMKA